MRTVPITFMKQEHVYVAEYNGTEIGRSRDLNGLKAILRVWDKANAPAEYFIMDPRQRQNLSIDIDTDGIGVSI